MKKVFGYIALVMVFVCLIIAFIVKPDFSEGSSQKFDPAKSQVDTHALEAEKARIKSAVHQLVEEYEGSNRQLFDEFMDILPEVGNSHFERAARNIGPFVNQVTSFNYCRKLCWNMAYDKWKGTHTTLNLLSPKLNHYLIQPSSEGERAVVNALNNFLCKLQENSNRLNAGLTSLLDNAAFSVQDLGLQEDFINSNLELAGKIQMFAIEKVATAVGVAIEIVMIRSTYRMIAAALAPLAAKMTGTVAAAGVCALADGPLPIGDIIGGVLTVGGLAWTGYDLYKVTQKLPSTMRVAIRTMIRDHHVNIKKEAIKRAQDAMRICRENSRSVDNSISQL